MACFERGRQTRSDNIVVGDETATTRVTVSDEEQCTVPGLVRLLSGSLEVILYLFFVLILHFDKFNRSVILSLFLFCSEYNALGLHFRFTLFLNDNHQEKNARVNLKLLRCLAVDTPFADINAVCRDKRFLAEGHLEKLMQYKPWILSPLFRHVMPPFGTGKHVLETRLVFSAWMIPQYASSKKVNSHKRGKVNLLMVAILLLFLSCTIWTYYTIKALHFFGTTGIKKDFERYPDVRVVANRTVAVEYNFYVILGDFLIVEHAV